MTRDETLSIDAGCGHLDDAIRFVDDRLAEVSCPDEVVKQIELAVEELFMNVANYAYSGSSGKVTLFIQRPNPAEKNVVIKMCDGGRPFNPLLLEDPDTDKPLEERDIGGLGIFLVKQMMNSVSYKYENGSNCVVMSKSW